VREGVKDRGKGKGRNGKGEGGRDGWKDRQ